MSSSDNYSLKAKKRTYLWRSSFSLKCRWHSYLMYKIWCGFVINSLYVFWAAITWIKRISCIIWSSLKLVSAILSSNMNPEGTYSFNQVVFLIYRVGKYNANLSIRCRIQYENYLAPKHLDYIPNYSCDVQRCPRTY